MGYWHSGNTTLTFKDNAGTTITVGPGEGNVSVGEMNASNKEVVQKHDRGTHNGWIETIDLTQEWSIQIDLENDSFTSAVAARIQDWLRKANFYSGLSSVSSDTWAFKAILTCDDGTTTTTVTLPEVVAQYTLAEAVEGHTLSISGRNAKAPTFT